MAITRNTIPSVDPSFALPFDASLAFASGATLTATGYLGSPTTLTLGQGRQSGIWVNDLSALDVASGDESYRFALIGSNDAAFTNGNNELLALRDVAAATAGRVVATILGATPTLPVSGRAGTNLLIPFINVGPGGIIFQYVRGYVVIGGTTPTVTLTSWLTLDYSGGGQGGT